MHIYLLLNTNVSNFITNYIVGPPSLYEGSLCNYKLSPTSSISSICVEEGAQMISSPKYATQQDNKSKSDNKTSCIKIFLSHIFDAINFTVVELSNFLFLFLLAFHNNFMKKTKDNLHLF